jgi:hypothetical protein
METNPNAFIGKLKRPTAAELSEALGASKLAWDRLVADMAREYQVVEQAWNSYSPKFGWSMRLKRGKRNIVHLAPCRQYFRVLFILGDKALRAARECGLSQRAMKLIDEAPRYPEGTGVTIDVKGNKDIPTIKKLAKVKLEN